jgi:hypothetical protein
VSSMRQLLIGLAFVSLSAPVFGQAAAPDKQSLPEPPPLPRPYLVAPPPASTPGLMAPGEGLPFRHWRDLLTKNDSLYQRGGQPGQVFLKPDSTASGWGASGHCSIPLIEMPLSEHFDDRMVQKMQPGLDDKIAITPPPVCAPHSARENPSKRK